MECREQTVDQRVKVFAGSARQDNAPNPRVKDIILQRKWAAAIDHHVVPAIHEPFRELLGKGLKSAVPGGDATRSKDGNVHGLGLLVHSYSTERSISPLMTATNRRRPSASKSAAIDSKLNLA